MLQRRARDPGIPTAVCNHTFLGTGITACLDNGGSPERPSPWPLTSAHAPANSVIAGTTRPPFMRSKRLESESPLGPLEARSSHWYMLPEAVEATHRWSRCRSRLHPQTRTRPLMKRAASSALPSTVSNRYSFRSEPAAAYVASREPWRRRCRARSPHPSSIFLSQHIRRLSDLMVGPKTSQPVHEVEK